LFSYPEAAALIEVDSNPGVFDGEARRSNGAATCEAMTHQLDKCPPTQFMGAPEALVILERNCW
jgi:hypothetical protein